MLESVIDRSPLLLPVETPLSQAIAALYDAQAPCGLVVASDQTLVGILTERDVLRLYVENRDLENLSLREVMAQPVISLAEAVLNNEAELGDCLVRFDQGPVPYLPLVDDQGRVTGLIGQATIRQFWVILDQQLKLTASEARLQEAQRLAKIGSWEWNPVEKTESWSAELYRLFELDSQQTSPSFQTLLAILPQEEQQKVLDKYQAHLENQLPYEYIYCLQSQDGSWKYIFDRVESIFDDQGQPLRTWGTCQDITETYRYQAVLQQLVNGTASVTGENFFAALVQSLAKALEVDYAMIAIRQGDYLQTLAWVSKGELQPNICYLVANTPCEKVALQGEYLCKKNVQTQFPQDQDLATFHAETYLGVALRGETEEVIGHLCVFSTTPWSEDNIENYQQIMRIFAVRASVELQRNLANEQLKQFNQSLEAKIAEQTLLLREKTQFQQAIFDSTDYFIVSTDIDGVIVSMNAGAEKLYGYSATALIGKTTPLIFADPEDLQQKCCYFSQQSGQVITPDINMFLEPVRQTGRLDIEVLTKHRDGHCFPLALTITPLKNQDQTIIGFLGIGKDITQEKLAVEALQKSDRRYNNLVAASPVGIFQNDAQGFCIYANDRCLAMTGLTPESGLGHGWSKTLHPEDRDWVFQAWQRFVTEKSSFNEEYRFVLADGSITWVMGQALVERDADGTVLGYLGTLTDITQRKQAELDRQTAIANLEEVVQQLRVAQQEISQNNQLLEAITKAQAQFITATDRLTIFDELLTDLLALTDSEYGFIGEVLFREDGTAMMEENLIKIKGMPYLKTQTMSNIAWDEETRKFYEENYQTGMEFTNMNTLFGAVIMTGKPVIANRPHTDSRRGGTPTGHPPLNAFLGLPFFRGDVLMGMVGIANRPEGYSEEIITFLEPFLVTCSNLIEGYRGDRQRKQAEAQLQLTNEELLRVTRLKDDFLANMSHELRTPLNAILGNTEILEDEIFGPINAKQLPPLNTITKSAHHLLALINDILDVAKIESGQIELHYSAIDIATLCQNSLALISPQALKKKIQLQTHLPPELPNLPGDERRVRQVLINLLNNAVKFTPEQGTISLTVSLQPPQSPALFPRLRFAIADTGIGIAPDNLGKLFRPFIQIDSALNRQYEGTGLGLALVKQIVELHGGEVGVTSQLGKGSCFTVDFPYPEDLPAVVWEESPKEPLPESEPTVPFPLIVLAEDNEANGLTVKSYLEAKGNRVIWARDGQAAIALTQREHPDLIVMDIQMPGLDGFNAIEQIRRHADIIQVPIIALTALAMEGDRERCLQAGADVYLSKPVQLKELVTLIQQLLAPPSR